MTNRLNRRAHPDHKEAEVLVTLSPNQRLTVAIQPSRTLLP